jgi:hypothetical protein
LNIDKNILTNLQKNSTELSYKQLTNYLNIPYYRGSQKNAQLKELSKFCKFIKDKTKYRIIEVYDIFLLTNDNRSTTMPSIEFILLNELSKVEINGVLFASNKELLKLCYIINNNYYSILSNKSKNIEIIAEKYKFDESFFEYVDKSYDILKPSLMSALKSMMNKNEIRLSTGFKLQKGDNCFVCVSVTEDLGSEIFKIQGDVMAQMGITKQSDLFGKLAYKRDEYYSKCNDMLKGKSKYDTKWLENKWDFDRFYQCHAIVLNQNKMIYDIQTNNKIKQELNQIVKDKIHSATALRDISYNNIDKWFEICNTRNGDKKYQFSEDIREYYKKLNLMNDNNV